MDTLRLESSLSKIGLTAKIAVFRYHGIDDEVLAQLNDTDLKELGIEKIGDRKRLLSAFANASKPNPVPSPSAKETGKVPSPVELPAHAPRWLEEKQPPAQPKSQPPPAAVPEKTASKPAAPTHASTVEVVEKPPVVEPVEKAPPAPEPFTNGLGLLFLPVPRFSTLLGICPVRVQDYLFYCGKAKLAYPACDFAQDQSHPVVSVTWEEAVAFCRWMTYRDRRLGIIREDQCFRLPTDLEWSAAVGLPHEYGNCPKERSARSREYPWGKTFPPPAGAGNYHASLWVDGFAETSPVGSFAPNKSGFYDMGGNVWEWCEDLYDPLGRNRVARGASCFNDDPDFLLSSYREEAAPDKRRNNIGIRIALADLRGKEPWLDAKLATT